MITLSRLTLKLEKIDSDESFSLEGTSILPMISYNHFIDEFLLVVHEISDQSHFMASLTSVTMQLNEKTRSNGHRQGEQKDDVLSCQI